MKLRFLGEQETGIYHGTLARTFKPQEIAEIKNPAICDHLLRNHPFEEVTEAKEKSARKTAQTEAEKGKN